MVRDEELQVVMQKRIAALQGDWFGQEEPDWKPPENKFLLFVSSTFTDTHEERNVLHALLPALRALATAAGLSIIFLDLRSGIPDANTLDHLTWIGCHHELTRCYQESAGCFFLSLQGSKYGYIPIPKTIEQGAFEKRLVDSAAMIFHAAPADELVALAREWYFLDTNEMPTVYVLKNLTGDWAQDKVFWDKVLPWLRELLQGLAFDPAFPDGVIGRSVTEYEVKAAVAMCNGGRNLNRIRWVRRHFIGGVTKDQDTRQFLFDGHEPSTGKKLDTLLAWMEAEFGQTGSGLMHTLSVSVDAFNSARDNDREYTFDEYLQKGKQSDAYALYHSAFQAHVRQYLTDSVVQGVAVRERWNSDGDGIGLDGAALGEMLQHALWAREKCAGFVGRAMLIREAVAAIDATTTHTHPSYGISLSIIGRSGTGKTALMAKLASVVRAADPQRAVIIRFCGISNGSADGLSLVQSLCLQLQVAALPSSSALRTQAVPSSYRGAVKLLQAMLAECPVVLFIDSLDQLSNKDLARSNVSFLRGVVPHADTRIIVSALPDDVALPTSATAAVTPAVAKKSYFYGSDICLKAAGVPRLFVPDFSDASGEAEVQAILHALLARKGRTLSAEQQAAVNDVAKQDPTVLHMNLLTHIVSHWRSFDGVLVLPHGGVAAAAVSIFERFERDFGSLLTRAALGFITWASQGISDVEMEDLLSLHNEALAQVRACVI